MMNKIATLFILVMVILGGVTQEIRIEFNADWKKMTLISPLENEKDKITPIREKQAESKSTAQYIDYGPLYINGNMDFNNTAFNEGWEGNGSLSNPYLILSLNITSNGNDALRVFNTDVYFEFRNCHFSLSNDDLLNPSPPLGVVWLNNVSNGIFRNNIIKQSILGIQAITTTNITFQHNIIQSHGNQALKFQDSNAIMIVNNTISNFGWNGIDFLSSSNINIENNSIFNSVGDVGGGIRTEATHHLLIVNNNISDNEGAGVILKSTHYCNITNNLISSNNLYGITFEDGGTNNTIEFNNILWNNQNGSQAYDNSENSTFMMNHWSDWINPDSDLDGIVDEYYSISGSSANFDPFPLVTPFVVYHLTSPRIEFPHGGEKLQGITTIYWTRAVDIENHAVWYTLYYSNDIGLTWFRLGINLSNPYFNWNTSSFPSGDDYLLRVRATCSEGVSINATTTLTFNLDNPPQIILQNALNNSILTPTTSFGFRFTGFPLSNVWYSWNNETKVRIAAPYTVTIDNLSGINILTMEAEDIWNATGVQHYLFYILSPLNPRVSKSLPNTAYPSVPLEYAFTITNFEEVSLELTLAVFGEDDTILEGNNSQISLLPGGTANFRLLIQPHHASHHQLVLELYHEELLYYTKVLDFNVAPYWQSPQFFTSFITTAVFTVGLAVILVVVFKRFATRTKRNV